MTDSSESDKVVLDKGWMKNFIDTEIEDFRTAIDKISKDGRYEGNHWNEHNDSYDIEDVRAVGNLSKYGNVDADNQVPLALGALVGKDGMGADLVKAVLDAAKQLNDVVLDQKKLFDDIEDALRETMDTLLNTEGESLDKIDGDKFITSVFEDVSDDIRDSLASGGGADSDGGDSE
ncbi:type VII secretion system-associated protein [Streptomyces sp. NPDC088788]|uniref:type VII secretion system-associated protein n=1 Tax=Streptomyces sp. NPDC088788 TaxID=3365898 RepID=UPI00381F11E0